MTNVTNPSEPATDSHVAVLAFPYGTHGPPLLNITRRLASAAPTTLFSFFSTAQSNSSLHSSDLPANIRFHDIPDGLPEGFTGSPPEAIELYYKVAPETYRREIAAAGTAVGRKVKCLLTDAFLWFAADMAVEMKASWVAFWAGGASSLSAHLYTDLIRETIGVSEVDGRMEDTLGFIPGMEKMRVKDTPPGVVFGNLDLAFSIALREMGLALPRATMVFLNSFEELDQALTHHLKPKFKHYLNIGPLALFPSTTQRDASVHDPHGCLAWIEKQSPASVVYIGFGTVMTPPPVELAAIAQGLESSKVPFIWSLKERNTIHLPKGFLDRTRDQGMVVPWAPQLQLLEHEAMGVFVNHCGWNSVLESVSVGVPMIGRPIFGDHGLNGKSAEVVWEIGMMISDGGFTKEGFEKCLDQVLFQDAGKKMKSNAKKFKEYAQKAVSTNGSTIENFKVLLDQVVKV